MPQSCRSVGRIRTPSYQHLHGELGALAVLLIARVFAPTDAFAQQEQAGSAPVAAVGRVDESTGSYTQAIPIEVPAFRGLEPALSLTYTSGGGNGFVGVGWTLTGQSIIERTGPLGYGSPTFGSNDTYTVDGEPLIPCASGSSSPSCSTAAAQSYSCIAAGSCKFYSKRREDYSRYKYDGSTDTWSVRMTTRQ